MSVFNDYSKVAKDYNIARLPNGVDLYLGLVYNLSGKTAENLHLLDAGCGTGNHVKYLLQKGVPRVTMMDANPEMLQQTRENLQEFIAEDRITILHHKLPEIPCKDASFDVVMSNQVFQHLTAENDTEFTVIQKTVEEVFRVLKPGGVFIVNLCTPTQIGESFWTSSLFPVSRDKLMKRLPDPELFCKVLRQVGFVEENVLLKPFDILIKKEMYYKEDGPLSETWRNSSSLMSGASSEEIEQAAETTRKLIAEGKMRDYIMDKEERRKELGQYVIYYAKKGQ